MARARFEDTEITIDEFSTGAEFVGGLSPDFIADACIPRKYVDAMRRMGYNVLYINEINGRMPDIEIMRLGQRLQIPIVTQNIRHFDSYYKLIPLKSRKSVRRLIRETMKHFSASRR